jgi:hypothetical protein
MYRNLTTSLVMVIALLAWSSRVRGDYVVINPHDDGWIRSVGTVYNAGNVTVLAGSVESRGIVEFPTAPIHNPIVSATLNVNPYSLPIWGSGIDVYGYGSNDGVLTLSDYNAGTYLGRWNVPDTLGFGEQTYFDVTGFLLGLTTPYAGFNLRTPDGGYQLSSLEYNYGHPPELTVTTIPEPSAAMLLAVGALPALVRHGRRR